MRIIGLDPGLRNLGWGVIELSGNKQTHIAHGVCHSGEGEMAIRLARLHEALAEVFATHQPDEAAVEHVFVNSDGAASLKLGQARAICLLVPAQLGLGVAEYAPNQIKKLVVGQGHANKEQVKYMLSMLLPGVRPSSLDATDALAIALAHAQIAASTRKLDAALLQAGAG